MLIPFKFYDIAGIAPPNHKFLFINFDRIDNRSDQDSCRFFPLISKFLLDFCPGKAGGTQASPIIMKKKGRKSAVSTQNE